MLVDTFGRTHDNLRISVTDRCNIRCFYCMPEDNVVYGPRENLLRFEEIERFVRVAVGLGVRKLRLTGGEPLIRKNLPELVTRLLSIDSVEDLALTTNAVLLAEQAQGLYDAGLRRLNVHLDTLNRERFREITRRDDFDRVMRGIERALELGFRIKMNAVALKNLTEPDIVPLAKFGRERGIEVRWIEFMPLDSQGIWDPKKVLLADEILGTIEREVGALEAVPDADPRAPATEYRYRDGGGRLGVVASVSRPFCGNCNRLRLTADGKLRYCLFAIEETDVRDLLRDGSPDAAIADRIRENVHRKWAGHEIHASQFVPPPRPMYAIGG
jgi:GTP 3',8-cyclase